MELNFQLMIAGIAILGIGVVVLLLGKKREVSPNHLLNAGRQIYDDLEARFERNNVKAFKVLSYVGMGLVLVGIGWTTAANYQ